MWHQLKVAYVKVALCSIKSDASVLQGLSDFQRGEAKAEIAQERKAQLRAEGGGEPAVLQTGQGQGPSLRTLQPPLSVESHRQKSHAFFDRFFLQQKDVSAARHKRSFSAA